MFKQLTRLGRFLAFLMLLVCTQASADYSRGLQAYLNGDYSLAQEEWLSAAESKDARSMFNLGLLHEHERLAESDQDKAINWFRLAGDHGYAPAYHHLALKLLSQNDQDDAALNYLKKASDMGFYPARQRMGLHTDHIASPTKYHSEAWILKKSRSNWTIQLLAFNEKQKVLDFINQHSIQGNSAVFKERLGGGEEMYKLVYGVYSDRSQAVQARQELSASLQQYGPWLRQFGSIQQMIHSQAK